MIVMPSIKLGRNEITILHKTKMAKGNKRIF